MQDAASSRLDAARGAFMARLKSGKITPRDLEASQG
jgi:hypothetical protein